MQGNGYNPGSVSGAPPAPKRSNNDLSVVKTLAEIALWRRGPRDLAVSGPVLVAVMGLYALQSTVQLAIATHHDVAILDGIVELAVDCAILAALLAVGGRAHRLPQTLLAVLGTEVLLAPLTIALISGVVATTDGDILGIALRLAQIAVVVWNLLIVAHILRAAFDVSLAVGVLLSIGFAVLSYVLNDLFWGPQMRAAGA